MRKVGSLHYEVMFKKAFGQPDIFTAFVRDMLGLELEIETVETEKRFEIPIGQVDVRFDLFAEDKKNRVIVEIQHEKKADHYDRFLYYHCATLLEQAARSTDYRPRLQVFTIVVLTSGDVHKREVAITDFTPHDLQGRPLKTFRHKLLFLCPKYANDATPEPYRTWLQAIDDSLDGEVEESKYHDPAILRVFDAISTDLITPLDRARMKDEHSDELLKQKKFDQGKMAQQRTTLRQALTMGLGLEVAAQLTGLTEDQATKLLQTTEDEDAL